MLAKAPGKGKGKAVHSSRNKAESVLKGMSREVQAELLAMLQARAEAEDD